MFENDISIFDAEISSSWVKFRFIGWTRKILGWPDPAQAARLGGEHRQDRPPGEVWLTLGTVDLFFSWLGTWANMSAGGFILSFVIFGSRCPFGLQGGSLALHAARTVRKKINNSKYLYKKYSSSKNWMIEWCVFSIDDSIYSSLMFFWGGSGVDPAGKKYLPIQGMAAGSHHAFLAASWRRCYPMLPRMISIICSSFSLLLLFFFHLYCFCFFFFLFFFCLLRLLWDESMIVMIAMNHIAT